VADRFTPEERSRIMSRVKSRDTKPEKLVRKLLHALGYRFRLHRRDLPGKPDITLPKHKKVIFVHGCFWHGHDGCQRAARPTSNIEFWNKKIDSNLRRDITAQKELDALGWSYFILWQCQTRDLTTLTNKLEQFLNDVEENQRI
jgi:DNA mismatch endonuclease (patch repair protein)